jgi:hypothetical protein
MEARTVFHRTAAGYPVRGPIRRSDFYNGELDDNTISPGGWAAVKTGVTSQVNLQPYDGEPVTEQERFVPQRIFTSPRGETIVDFGQNMAGWVELRVKGHRGIRSGSAMARYWTKMAISTWAI